MHHLVAHCHPGLFAFTTWAEGLELWHAVHRVIPRPVALCVMPDHVHVLCHHDRRLELAQALAGVTRRRNLKSGKRTSLWHRLPNAQPVVGHQKIRRSVRYIHLNPCRARLVADPLSWPLSSHRLACGLSVQSVVSPGSAEALHAYVSADPTVNVAGTALPTGHPSAASAVQVLAAVSAMTQTPVGGLRRDPFARSLFVQVARTYGVSRDEAMAAVPMGRRSLYRVAQVSSRHVEVVCRVVGDPRFPGLHHHDLRASGAWRRVYPRHLCPDLPSGSRTG